MTFNSLSIVFHLLIYVGFCPWELLLWCGIIIVIADTSTSSAHLLYAICMIFKSFHSNSLSYPIYLSSVIYVFKKDIFKSIYRSLYSLNVNMSMNRSDLQKYFSICPIFYIISCFVRWKMILKWALQFNKDVDPKIWH